MPVSFWDKHPKLNRVLNRVNKATKESFLFDIFRKSVPDKFKPLPVFDMFRTERVQPYPVDVNALYLMIKNSMHLTAITLRLNQEIFRQDLEIIETGVQFCETCDIAYEEEVETCENCDGEVIEPNTREKYALQRWMKKCNAETDAQDLSLPGLLWLLNRDVEITDEFWLLVKKDYKVDKKGNILSDDPVELLRGNPPRMRLLREQIESPVHNDELRTGFTCVLHRERNISDGPGVCRECGREMHKIVAVSLDDNGDPYIGYIKGEVYHASKYSPSETYGHSNIVTAWIAENTILNMDLMANMEYREQRPPKGVLAINTKNFPSMIAQLEAEEKIREQNPMHISRIAVESDSKSGGVQWIPITPSYEELQTIDMKADYIRRVAAMYGVLPMFTGDLSTSGGLNNEGMQVTVTLHAVMFGHAFYHDGVFPWLMKQLSIKHHTLRFPDPIEEDKIALQERRMNNLNQMKTVLNMGAEVKITDADELTFDIEGDLTKPEPEPFGGGGGFGSEPGEQFEPEEEYSPDIETYSNTDFLYKSRGSDEFRGFKSDLFGVFNDIFGKIETSAKDSFSAAQQKDLARSVVREIRKGMERQVNTNYADMIIRGFEDAGVSQASANIDFDSIRAIAEKAPIWKSFDGISDSLTKKFEEIITDAFAVPGEFSPALMTDRMKQASEEEAWKLTRIARSETNAVVNLGRKLGYDQRDPEGNFKFKLTGRFNDGRTCDAHNWINSQIQAAGGSVTMKHMEALHKAASEEFFPKLEQRGFTIHPNQRKSIVRVVK